MPSDLPPVLLCDLDGVVWLAHEPIAGSVEAIARAREAGIRVVFVTNNSRSLLRDQEQALEHIGIPATDDVLTSSMATARLVQPGWRVLVSGGPGLIEAVVKRNATPVTAYSDEAERGEFDAVVVGMHFEFDYRGLRLASTAVRNGARLIASNTDSTYPTPDGEIPGGGSIVAAISTASGTKPVVAGKPFEPMADAVREITGLSNTSQCVMVGDRPETDGAFAATLGCRFGLVLSGVTRVGTGLKYDFVEPDLAGIVTSLLK